MTAKPLSRRAASFRDQLTDRQPTAQVFHVYRYKERWELEANSPHCRTTGLHFLRWYCEADPNPEAIEVRSQIDLLRHHDNYHELLGLLVDLIVRASRYSPSHRGYLLDSDLRPISGDGLARAMGIDRLKMKEALSALLMAGLIDTVDVPTWDLNVNGVSGIGSAVTPDRSGTGPAHRKSRSNSRGKGAAKPHGTGTGKSRANGTGPMTEPQSGGSGSGPPRVFCDGYCENIHSKTASLRKGKGEDERAKRGKSKYSNPPGVPPGNSQADSAKRPPPPGPVAEIPGNPWPGEREPWNMSSLSPLIAGTGTGNENGNPPGGGIPTEIATVTPETTGEKTEERQIENAQADTEIAGPDPGSVRDCSTVSDPLAAVTKRARIACTAPPPGAAFAASPLEVPEARQWAERVYVEMGLTYRMDSLPGVQNLGSFASAYIKICGSGLPGDLVHRILHNSVIEAQRLCRKRIKKKPGNKPAIWNSIVDERINSYTVRQ